MSSKGRPRYGLILATTSTPENSDRIINNSEQYNASINNDQWSNMCKKISKRNWTYIWNQTSPASWTFPPSSIESCPKPKLFSVNSLQIVDVIHTLLDSLPDNGPLGYLLDVFWITDKIPYDVSNTMVSVNDDYVDDDYVDDGLPAAFYGALKRCFDWHGGHIQVLETLNHNSRFLERKYENELESDNFLQLELYASIRTLQSFLEKDDCFSSCKKKCTSDRLIWRGSVGFYEDVDSSLYLQRLRGFQIYAKDEKSFDCFNRTEGNSSKEPNSNVLMSRTLKSISTCDVNTVPVYFLTAQHFYLTVNDTGDEVYDHFLCPEGEFFGNSGVIVKLDYVSIQGRTQFKRADSKLSFENWKKYITNSQSLEESLEQLDTFEDELEHSLFFPDIAHQSGNEHSGQTVKSLFFLVMNDLGGGLRKGSPYDNGHYTKLCILLDPSAAEGGGQFKSFKVMQDTFYPKFEDDGDMEEKQEMEQRLNKLSITSDCNVPKLYTFIRQVQSAVLEMIVKNEGAQSEYLSRGRLQSTLAAIQVRILQKFNAFKREKQVPSEINQMKEQRQDTFDSIYFEEDDSVWEEKRFIAFIERLNKDKNDNKQTTSMDATMKPNAGDFVILEAKEMLKLFTSEGLAKNPENCEEIVIPQGRKRGGFDWDKAGISQLGRSESWPEILLSEHLDLCFNRNEKSEELDRERAKLQIMYVGNKETASTCHVQNSSKGPPPVVVTKKKPSATLKDGEEPEALNSTSHEVKSSVDTKLNKIIQTRDNSNNVQNPSQPRRSPRKKVSVAYRSAPAKPSTSIVLSDGKASIHTSDTNSTISNKKQLPNSSKKYLNHKRTEVDCKTEINERGDNHTTRSGKSRGNAVLDREQNSQTQNVTSSDGNNDNFKKKMRNAVYDALVAKNIDKEHKLFRPCFKKLFDICMMYGKDLAKTNKCGSGTRQILSKIAGQNVDSVINLEKTLFSNATV